MLYSRDKESSEIDDFPLKFNRTDAFFFKFNPKPICALFNFSCQLGLCSGELFPAFLFTLKKSRKKVIVSDVRYMRWYIARFHMYSIQYLWRH